MAILTERKTWRRHPERQGTHSRATLTPDEQKNVGAALRFLRVKLGGGSALRRALGVSGPVVDRATGKRGLASASLAVRAARAAGVPVDDVLTGRFPPAGSCPHCGRGPDP